MSFKTIVFLVSLCSIAVFSQKETTISSIVFPKVENKFDIKSKPKTEASSQYSISKPFEITKFKSATKIYSSPTLEKPMDFNTKKSDLDPGLVYEKKLNSKKGNDDESTIPFRGNQFLGEFRTGTKAVGIFYRDFGLVDGDIIRVLVNDKVVVYEVFLDGKFQELNLPLQEGFNKVEFQALNQGTSGPNTAEFQVYDEKGILISSNQWNLATGFKASIVIVKQ
ncbi:hypothetical protein [Flavobacterium sp.]|uniref:hypothetical protein n=1 Tax=Flavobacterium sp. TaxID=239 RepID=UPI00286E5FD4|nr:hypothetical protein [Flavobacterium sp.]